MGMIMLIISNKSQNHSNEIGIKDEFNIHKFKTPIGEMIAGAVNNGLCLLEFCDTNREKNEITALEKSLKLDAIIGKNNVINQTIYQLEEYFAKKRKIFDIPLLTIGTQFQINVWYSLLTIPYSTTISYKQQATNMEKPSAVRAIASANGKNKISIIIPCHRVVGIKGDLVGYGGGLHRKQWLLDLEKQNL